jgi:Icc protein
MTSITKHPKSGRIIRVLQITDTHLFADSSGHLLGLNTEQSLQAVIAKVRANHLPSDLILATGDLVHDGTPAAYQRVFSHLESFGLPVYCLPGNHDEALTLQQTLDEGFVQYVEHTHHGNWHFIFLDSTIADSEKAHLTQETLQMLEQHLQSATDTNTLVCLHHQPGPRPTQIPLSACTINRYRPAVNGWTPWPLTMLQNFSRCSTNIHRFVAFSGDMCTSNLMAAIKTSS